MNTNNMLNYIVLCQTETRVVGMVRENHPQVSKNKLNRNKWKKSCKNQNWRINLVQNMHGIQKKVPKTIYKIIFTPMEGSHIKRKFFLC